MVEASDFFLASEFDFPQAFQFEGLEEYLAYHLLVDPSSSYPTPWVRITSVIMNMRLICSPSR